MDARVGVEKTTAVSAEILDELQRSDWTLGYGLRPPSIVCAMV